MPQPRRRQMGELGVLVMDGHSSHYTLDLLHYAQEHNIIVIGYPPCTHILQRVDMACFAKMKTKFWKEIEICEDLHFAMCTRKTLLVSLPRHIFQLSPLKPLKLLLQLLDCIHSTPMPSWKSRWSLAYWPPQRAASHYLNLAQCKQLLLLWVLDHWQHLIYHHLIWCPHLAMHTALSPPVTDHHHCVTLILTPL